MLSEKMLKAINEQINKELYSAYLYLSMSADCESKCLGGFANWLKVQYNEETEHAMKLYKYVLEQGGKIELMAIDKPSSEFGTCLEMFQKVLEHEKFVTKSIHDLYALAIEEKDYASQIMLQWFVSEQVEEEAHATEIVERLKMAGNSVGALLMYDRAMGERK